MSPKQGEVKENTIASSDQNRGVPSSLTVGSQGSPEKTRKLEKKSTDVTVEHGYFDFKNIKEYSKNYDELIRKCNLSKKLDVYLGLNQLQELSGPDFLVLLQIYPRLYMLAADKASCEGGIY